MNTDLMFSSKTDKWETPQDFFDKLNDEFNFTLDVCALPENAKCSNYYTPEQEGVARLRELAKADKDGRVVVLPCKPGDGLWTFCSHPVEQVYSFTVTDISTLNGRTMLNTSRCGVIDARDVGKTVFLTREEAEKELMEAKEG